ncbi:MAG: methyltransferase domain-containing protein [Myxococcota bacterium]
MGNGVASHYGREGLLERILDAARAAGQDPNRLDPDALAGVDQFHLGGRAATAAIAEALSLHPEARLLDVGCGVGGPARFLARTLGVHVTGVDLTAAFVEAARELSRRSGFAERTHFQVGHGTQLAFADGTFDAVTLIHVGMNVPDKTALFRELARVTRPGGHVLIYDVMRLAEGELRLPVPWATDVSTHFLAHPHTYLDALAAAGLEVSQVTDRSELALEVLGRAARSPPPVHLGHLMGERWPEMFGHLRTALEAGVVGPVQIVAHT